MGARSPIPNRDAEVEAGGANAAMPGFRSPRAGSTRPSAKPPVFARHVYRDHGQGLRRLLPQLPTAVRTDFLGRPD